MKLVYFLQMIKHTSMYTLDSAVDATMYNVTIHGSWFTRYFSVRWNCTVLGRLTKLSRAFQLCVTVTYKHAGFYVNREWVRERERLGRDGKREPVVFVCDFVRSLSSHMLNETWLPPYKLVYADTIICAAITFRSEQIDGEGSTVHCWRCLWQLEN